MFLWLGLQGLMLPSRNTGLTEEFEFLKNWQLRAMLMRFKTWYHVDS